MGKNQVKAGGDKPLETPAQKEKKALEHEEIGRVERDRVIKVVEGLQSSEQLYLAIKSVDMPWHQIVSPLAVEILEKKGFLGKNFLGDIRGRMRLIGEAREQGSLLRAEFIREGKAIDTKEAVTEIRNRAFERAAKVVKNPSATFESESSI